MEETLPTLPVRLIKTSSDVDIIGEIVSLDENKIVVRDPMVLMIDTILEDMAQYIFLLPLFPSGILKDRIVEIRMNGVLMIGDLEKDSIDNYHSFVAKLSEKKAKKTFKASRARDKNVIAFNEFVKSNTTLLN